MRKLAVRAALVALLAGIFSFPPAQAQDRPVRVGSKVFTESYVLAEILSQVAAAAEHGAVERRLGMGGTGLLYQALVSGEIDLYPEYTGTIAEAILKDPKARTLEAIAAGLRAHGLVASGPLGFNNTYALAVRRDFAAKHGLRSISDLARVPEIRAGFSHEFMTRPDGLPGLRRQYGLRLAGARSIEHSLAYGALAEGELDLTDVYSTDAKIAKLDLAVLTDDREFFPRYLAVVLARAKFVEKHPAAWQALRQLEGSLDERAMIRLNGLVDLEKRSFSQAAADFLRDRATGDVPGESISQRVWRRTREHVRLVTVSLLLSTFAGIPLGVLASRRRYLGQAILLASGMLQTIPSLALLCFLIPLFGIGAKPALVALFLYGLLPIVTGTTTGLQSIDQRLLESARALGLSPRQRLRLVELPLASPSILAGIRTSAVIAIGTATLAALIGAGGYGAPIVTGLALNDMRTVLIGALPAAALALLVHVLFEGLARWLTPTGLRHQA